MGDGAGHVNCFVCVCVCVGCGRFRISLFYCVWVASLARAAAVCINSGWMDPRHMEIHLTVSLVAHIFGEGQTTKRGRPTFTNSPPQYDSLGISCNCLLVFRVGPLSVKRKRGRSRTPNKKQNLTSITSTDG